MVLAAGWEAPQVATLIAALLAFAAGIVSTVVAVGATNKRWLREVRHPAYAKFAETARRFIDQSNQTWFATMEPAEAEREKWEADMLQCIKDLEPIELEVEQALGEVEVVGGDAVRNAAVLFADAVSEFTTALLFFEIARVSSAAKMLRPLRLFFIEQARTELGAVAKRRWGRRRRVVRGRDIDALGQLI